nr:MAG TPA: hypothetical protein [Bacteriophage sp.]
MKMSYLAYSFLKIKFITYFQKKLITDFALFIMDF